MEKKHAKHRAIPSSIINHPVYKGMKAASKYPHRYDMWEDSVVAGLHVFELVVVIGFLGLLVGTMILGTDTFARIG
jgi:hypothetical protein